MKPRVLAIIGPTASGKSDLALKTARELDGEIISADSMQVYRGMDIGTAKPTPEEQQKIVHHLIDIADPDEEYSAGQFQKDAARVIREVSGRGKLPILAGGSGLYINALTYGLDLSSRPQADPVLRKELEALSGEALYERLQKADAAAAMRIHPHNTVRVRRALEIALQSPQAAYDFDRKAPEFDFVIVGLTLAREELYRRIDARVDLMMKMGLPDEVRNLYGRYGGEVKAMQAIGYKEIVSWLTGRTPDLQEAAEQIKRNTRHFAKRQLTWFKRDSRIVWLEAPGRVQAIATLLKKGQTDAEYSS